jgi:hypothetical protein
MTYPEDMLEGLDPTDEERLEFLRVLDETEAEEEAGLLGGDGGEDDYGPWLDQDQAARLAAAGDQVDDSYGRAAAVAAEDDEDEQWRARRPSGEDKLARAIGRIERDSYTPPAMFRPARDTGGRYASACGPVDPDFGHCTSRYHAMGCGSAVATAAATGSAEAVRAWNSTLDGNPTALDVIAAEQQLGLANEPGPWDGSDLWSDLLHNPEPGPGTDVRAWVLHRMGEADQPAPEPRADLPDVSALRAQLGI